MIAADLIKENLGGEFNLEVMNFVQRAIIKKKTSITESVSRLDKKSIMAFAAKININ